MTDFQLRIGKRTYPFSGPSAWSELTAHQAVSLWRFRSLVSDQPASLFPVLMLLYGMGRRQLRWLFDARFLQRKRVRADQQTECLALGQALIDTVNWVGETLPTDAFVVPHFRLFDFQFGSWRVLRSRIFHRRRYYSPAEGLGNLTFGEFMYADQAHKVGNLARLSAILYRRTGKLASLDDVRQPFDSRRLDRDQHYFQQLDPALLHLIGAQYEACLRSLQRHFSLVFSVADEATAKSKGTDSAGWLDVAINMAKLDPTKVPQIEQQNLYLVLKVLNEGIRQAEELEEQLDKMKRK
ncbi:hypothetical protein IC229_05855 [Spirosoma sp. BT702]|uniref:Uncharacterized protein n=1 Tax=Spirosoma profusum TaxID=2771354 RepID=A0A926XUT1_9BACT|nr:hypothetical protein [Spirosoma profusum]MBD2700150.1 hypothetical protein [Spirosoma profusum]